MNDHVNDPESNRNRPATIRDVAERAGVSRQTVSRAMNDKGEISPETQEHVLRVARELGYRPNAIARSLKTDRTMTLGLVVPDIANPFFAEVARGASEAAHQLGYSVMLCNTDEQPEREWELLSVLQSRRVDGLVLVSSRLDEPRLRQAVGLWRPIVAVNREPPLQLGVGAVVVDEAEAAQAATSHLIERGHRRIGLLSGLVKSRSGLERRRGHAQALRAAGLGPDERYLTYCLPTVEGGRQAARGLLQAQPAISALLCYNDLVALGARHACRELSLAVPEDCALVGWDDIVFSAYASPPLTTVQMPKYEMGQRAMSLLFELMQGVRETQTVHLQARLLVRDST